MAVGASLNGVRRPSAFLASEAAIAGRHSGRLQKAANAEAADGSAQPRGPASTLVVCNWKCYPSTSAAREQIKRFAKMQVPRNVEVLTAPCSVFLREMVAEYDASGSMCVVCSQDVSSAQSAFGPFTGDVTAGLLKDLGVGWTILGHSERRDGGPLGIDESRQLINRKLTAALEQGLKVILCVGESGDRDPAYVTRQLEDICTDVANADEKLVVAYEPNSSVGTDRPVAAEEVNQTITDIKSNARCNLRNVRFIYGGSVDGSNAAQYTTQPNIDGIIVGRLWQKPDFEELLAIISTAS
ncbi:triosephosphate isomerase [Babesia caballi]|uniref:Triosephosphate isomerase n=1 Tax=Babesia caballi TaxID=5871 RepID=A0AAV4LN54_BABCB|nr:triosephosphate isomerase [Babesia caballi]